jgi:CRP-like cAMP-binding protein
LRGVPLFASLGDDDRLRALWELSVPRAYASGEILRSEGAPADHLLVLLDGRSSASSVPPAGACCAATYAGPCALDKVALIDGAGHTATFTAVTPCAVRALPRTRFLALVDDSAAVRAHVLRVLAAQARSQQRRLTDTATLPAEARLAAWLLERLADEGHVALPGGGQRELADLLGVTRVTVNRALSRLRRDGLIGAAPDGEVRVLAPELLALRAAPGG